MSMVSRSAFVFIALVVISLSQPATGQQQHAVFIESTGFNPSSLTISVGDNVLWYNFDMAGPHTTTSDLPIGNPDYWNVTLSPSTFYTRTFVRAGTFPYHDSLGGFTGTIIVIAPRLDTPRMVNGQFVFDATGLTVGRTNFLQSSTNLANWVTTRTNKATSNSMTFTNAVSAGHSFFRLIEIR